MDWESIGQRWRSEGPTHTFAVDELAARDRKLRRQVRRRDRIEAIAAVLGGGIVLYVSISVVLDGNWAAFGFGMLLVAYAVSVPVVLRAARAKVPEPAADLPLRQRLLQQRDAALVQAHLLELAWLWYVLPLVIGVVGLVVSIAGPSKFAWACTAGMLVFGLLLAWLNRMGGRHFRNHADSLERQADGDD